MNKNNKSLFSKFLNKIKPLLLSLFQASKRRKKLSVSATAAIIIVLLIIPALYFIEEEYHHLNTEVVDRREAVVTLATSLAREHLDRIVDLDVSLTTRPKFRDAVSSGRWSDAIDIVEGIPKTFSYVDDVMLLDSRGTLVAMSPMSLDVMEKDFSARDYFQEVQKGRKPYVSGVFNEPEDQGSQAVAVSVPVMSLDGSKMEGVLILCIKLHTIAEWSKGFAIGTGGAIYIADRKGRVISHTHTSWRGGIIDYSAEFPVQHALMGEHGVKTLYASLDQERVLAAYSSMPTYGWAVVVTQPMEVAFSERNNELLRLVVPWALIISFVGLSFYFILKNKEFLRRERDKGEMFLEGIGDGVVAIDRNWDIVFWNRAATAITGWHEEEVIGRPFRSVVKFIREMGRTEYFSFIEDAIVSGNNTSIPHGTVLVKKDGSEVPVGDSASPLVNERGQAEGAIIIFRDSSKEVEVERLRSDLAYATHQLRTPVTEAIWNLEIAMDEEDATKRKEDLLVVHNSLLSVRKLAEHLVEVSSFDQGAKVLKIETVKIVDVFSEVQKKLKVATEKSKTPVFFGPVSAVLAIQTDIKILTKAIFEVAENAVLYSPENSSVTVNIDMRGKNLVVEVVDHGFGIPEEEQPLLFTKFFRGSNRGSKSVGGGLGLFIARECVKLLGGKIWFESEEGKGTTFYISVPVE